MIIGIVSDTHGRLVPGLDAFLRGCDEVLHAGDVTAPCFLEELRAFAPITAVRGNNDHAMQTPPALVRHLGGLAIAMVHDLGTPGAPAPAIRQLIDAHLPDLVIHGHTHVPSAQTFDGCLYVNPGSAGGWGRSGRSCTLARLDLAEHDFALRFFEVCAGRLVPFGSAIERAFGSRPAGSAR